MIYSQKKKIWSIGEEKRYLSKKVKAGRAKEAERRKLKRLEEYTKTKNVFGKVFITKSSDFGDPTAYQNKTRRVVAIKADKDGMVVIPVRKSGPILPLSRFDGNRLVNVMNAKDIDFNGIYEKQKFKKTSNDSLTKEEKRKLLNRVIFAKVHGK